MEHRRIYRAKNKETVIQSLIASETPLFKQIWRVLIFASAVGYWNQKPEALGKFDSALGIDFQTFGNTASWPGYIYLMSLVETEDSSALTSEEDATERRIKTFEEYANGGLSIIRERCEPRSYSLDSIIELMLDTNAKSEASGDLSEIAI